MQIIETLIGDLIPAEYNPRQLTKDQHRNLTESIKRFGLVDPIIANSHKGRENIVIGGHQRLKIALQEGYKTVPVVYLDLTEEKEKELNIRLNRNVGEWDWDKMANFDLDFLKDIGFDDKELAKGLNLKLDVEEDEAPEPPKEPKSKLGDLYILGNHRLLCGDATKKEDVERLMDGQKADMVFTDPPYGIDYQDVKGSFDKIANDDGDISSLVWKALAPLDVEVAFVCCNWPSSHDMAMAMDSANLPVKSCIVWDKGSRIQNLDLFAKRHEFILYSGPFGGQPTREDDVWNIPRQTRSDHPTAKPIALSAKAIGLTDGQIVADPFGGSGSTLIACEQLNRKCYMMEIDPRYCDVIVERWEKFTGKKAIKL